MPRPPHLDAGRASRAKPRKRDERRPERPRRRDAQPGPASRGLGQARRHRLVVPTAMLALWSLLGPGVLRADGPVPVVVAVDTSRSLDAAELERATSRLAAVVAGLPDRTPTGLLAFDDAPRWIVPLGSSPAEVAARLPELTPRGAFTLLHDALFVASRDLRDGGVVLLATDGRDENSATTVEDIARRAEAQGVRILAVGTGRPLEEKALRRLALLSEGTYLGAAGAVSADEISRTLDSTRRTVAAAAAERSAPPTAATPPLPPPVAAVTPSPTAPTRPPVPTTAQRGDPLWGWVAAGSIAVALLLGVVLLRGRSAPRPDRRLEVYCERCGTELPHEGAECPHCRATELRHELLGRAVAARREVWEVTGDTAVVDDPSLVENLEKTRVLAEQHVLLVRAKGEESRSFVLGPLKAFGVGREEDAGNTLPLLDPALSAHHFRVVPHDGQYHLLDLGSTNGTWFDGERIDLPVRLRPGDRFRAGRIEFEFQTHLPGF